MTPAIPPDAKRVVLAAVVPCGQPCPDDYEPCDRGRHHCVTRPEPCSRCRGDGTRTVVTDIEVEPDDAVSGDTTVRVWLEVQL